MVEPKTSTTGSLTKEGGVNAKTVANKTISGRNLTSQEESILLPLIQGLIAAGAVSSDSAEPKQKNSAERTGLDKSTSRRTNGPKASQPDNNNELSAKGKAQLFLFHTDLAFSSTVFVAHAHSLTVKILTFHQQEKKVHRIGMTSLLNYQVP